MINISRNSISKILVFVVVILLLPGILYYFYSSSDQAYKSRKLSFDEDLSEFLTQLNKRWRYGDIEANWNAGKIVCSDIPKSIGDLNPEFLKCNPAYLKCWLSGLIEGLDPVVKGENHSFVGDPKSIAILNKGDVKIDFVEQSTKREFSVKLERNCHQAFLPQKVYSSGPDGNSPDLWDNYGREIFIDQYYVSHWDMQMYKSKKFTVTKDSLNPVLNLDISEQKKYCFSRGRKLLQNHIFEAATYFPSVYKDGYLFKSKVPWAKVINAEELREFKKSNCDKIFTKECEKEKKWVNKSPLSASWIGIYHSLGSHLESFENLFNRNANLKISSSVVPVRSLWNFNGRRGFWSGNNFQKSSFDFTEFYSQRTEEINFEDLKGVAFRCMSIK